MSQFSYNMQICCTDSVRFLHFYSLVVPVHDDHEDSFFLVNLEKLSGSLALFRNKRFMLDEMAQQNASKFAM